jgi:hypothetical protein
MICKRCRHRYDANLAATYPGGFEAPGTFFYLSLILALATFLLWIFRVAYLPWFGAIITGFITIQIWFAWSACHGACGFSETGGETCPECQHKNRIYPWSF